MSIRRVYRRARNSAPFQVLRDRLDAGDEEITIRGVPGSLLAFVLAWSAENVPGPVVAVCATEERAEELRDDLERVLGTEEVGYFPAWDVSPYDGRSPHLDVMGLRLEALHHLREGRGGVVVVPVAALLSHTVPPDTLSLAAQGVRPGQKMAPDALADHLSEIGYERVTTVEGVGQFGVRGGIVDVCSFGNEHPVRLEFMGDEIASLRAFDLETQRSVKELGSSTLLPCREAVLPVTLGEEYDGALSIAEQRLGQDLTVFRETLARQGLFDGLEHYLGVLYGEGSGLLDYLPEGCLVAVDDPDGVAVGADDAWEEAARASERQRPRRGEPEVLPAGEILRRPEEVLARLAKLRRVLNLALGGKEGEALDFAGRSGRHYEGHQAVLQEDVQRFWREDYEIVILCESAGQQARFEELLGDAAGLVSIYVGTLHSGFTFPSSRIHLVNDHEVYSRYRRRWRYRRFQDGAPIKSVTVLQRGDFVVHVDHGIGQYEGMERLTVDGVSRDCLTVAYRGGDRVFVPVDQMDRVQKFASEEGVVPVLSKLGTAAWERLKARTRQAIFKMAAELISLYAERKARPGEAFSADDTLHNALAASFPYQETRDQLQAIDEVREDMERPASMDRLVCGDVGYGKTEVAVRAAFKVVADGKQVAVLAPTTILAQQHYRTFLERMNGLPVNVEVLSRFRTRAQQLQVVSGLKSGQVDVVIGTHRLLSKDVTFRDLGLLVVDEEHRFGVRHKERLKQMRRLVDVLTLTATPIPRTLHMSLMGTRDMSIIRTPPKDRLPIFTEVLPFDEDRVAEAVLREVDRGGQVYFVHNRIQSMLPIMDFLEGLLPQVRFGMAHGQMPERQLEKVMMDFLDGRYDCLVSTMIIESGLDIPSVNTLVVNRADRLGLAQLYQLRGRVGRSSRQAYAYLLIPSRKALSRAAVRRLRAIEEFSELGSGFQISMRDMEIRGAGNLLGAQQHGRIAAVGFDLYCRLLDEAVRELKGEESEPAIEPEIRISVSAYIPDDYIPDPDLKMEFYQRLGEVRHTVEVLAMREELEDRFGGLPAPTVALLDTIEVKVLARQLRLSVVQVGVGLGIEFSPERVLSRKDVEEMVSHSHLPLQFYLGEQAKIEVELEGKGPRDRLACAKKVLQSLI